MAGGSGGWSYATDNRHGSDDPGHGERLIDRRATLRLLFPPRLADRLALLSGRPDPDQSLRRLIDLTRPRYLLRSWRQRLPGGTAADPAPLGPGNGIGGREALALALQLGMSVTGDELAELFRRSADEIGEDLYNARKALDPKLPMPCPEQIPALGRHRDPSLGVNERIGLLRHTADCASCRTVLERFQQIDAGLLEELGRERAALAEQPLPRVSLPSRLVTSPAALILAGVLVLALVIGAAGFGLSRLASSRHAPIPLLAAAASPDATAQAGRAAPTGWLILTTTDNGVEAVNLTTAAHRTIVPGNRVPGVSFRMLSPNRKLLAALGPIPPNSTASTPVPVVIRRLDGTVVANHQLDYSSSTIPWLLGWLNDDTLLVQDQPSIRENSPPVPPEVTINAINITRWKSRRFFAGDVSQLSISPDGKLALVMHQYDPNWKGQTVELRPVLPDGSGLGSPLATIEHRGVASIINTVWAPDSSRVYVPRIDDIDVQTASDSTPAVSSEMPRQVSIIAIDRQGHSSTVLDPGAGGIALPIGISAGGQTMYYQYEQGTAEAGSDNQGIQVSIWSAGIDGSHRQKLGGVDSQSGPPGILTANWDPDTVLYINDQEPYLNGVIPAQGIGNPLTWPVVEALQGGRSPLPVLSLPNIVTFEALAWLPESALPEQSSDSMTEPNPASGQPTAPEAVPGVEENQITDASSSVSGDGRYVVLNNLTDRSPEINDRSNVTLSHELRPDDNDPSWIPYQDIVITATRPTQSNHSQLRLWTTAPQQGNFPIYNGAEFDPANLANASPSQVYANPAVSPDGLSTAFFVFDRANNNVDLWLAQAGQPARAVDHWSDGTKQSGTLPLLATWVDSRTLLYAMPGSWQDNLPQQPQLVRLTINPDGSFDQKVLLTLPKSGFDRGVAVDEMALSQDGRQLALRVRHFGQADHNSGVSDAIVVMPASDLEQRVQIEQAAPGDGLSWSPSGEWLTYGLDNKVEIASANGTTLHEVDLPAGTSGASPLWVGANEVWFTWDNGLQRQLRRVVVR